MHHIGRHRNQRPELGSPLSAGQPLRWRGCGKRCRGPLANTLDRSRHRELDSETGRNSRPGKWRCRSPCSGRALPLQSRCRTRAERYFFLCIFPSEVKILFKFLSVSKGRYTCRPCVKASGVKRTLKTWWYPCRPPRGAMVKNPPAHAGEKRCGFDLRAGKTPWRRAWQPTPVFLPGESHAQRSLAGYGPWGRKESDMTEHTHTPMNNLLKITLIHQHHRHYTLLRLCNPKPTFTQFLVGMKAYQGKLSMFILSMLSNIATTNRNLHLWIILVTAINTIQ